MEKVFSRISAVSPDDKGCLFSLYLHNLKQWFNGIAKLGATNLSHVDFLVQIKDLPHVQIISLSKVETNIGPGCAMEYFCDICVLACLKL